MPRMRRKDQGGRGCVPLLPGNPEPGEGRGVWIGADRSGAARGLHEAERKGKREIKRAAKIRRPQKCNVHWARLRSRFSIADVILLSMGALRDCAESGRLELLGLQSNPQRFSGVPSTPTGSTLRGTPTQHIYTIHISIETRNVHTGIIGCTDRGFRRPGHRHVSRRSAAWGVAELPGRRLQQRWRDDPARSSGSLWAAAGQPDGELRENVHNTERDAAHDGTRWRWKLIQGDHGGNADTDRQRPGGKRVR